MVTNLILLCSLKTSLFQNLKTTLQENMGYLIHLFFQAGIRVPIVLDISDTYPFFSILSFFMNNFLHSHMPLFCNKTFER
jgi:hypothetical protein